MRLASKGNNLLSELEIQPGLAKTPKPELILIGGGIRWVRKS